MCETLRPGHFHVETAKSACLKVWGEDTMTKKPEPVAPKFNAAAAPRKPPEKPTPAPKPSPPKMAYNAPVPPGPGMGSRSPKAPQPTTVKAGPAAPTRNTPKATSTTAPSAAKVASVSQPGKGTALKQQFARASAKGQLASQFKVTAKRNVTHER